MFFFRSLLGLMRVIRIIGVGYFKGCYIRTEDTRDGIKLSIEVVPYPEVKTVKILGMGNGFLIIIKNYCSFRHCIPCKKGSQPLAHRTMSLHSPCL